MKKALIIKTGRRETFAPSILATPSLGDVLRTTVLLRTLSEFEIDWVTSSEAAPLLREHPRLGRVYLEGDAIPWAEFDLILNLESDDLWFSAFASSPAEKRGFLDRESVDLLGRKESSISWSQALFRLAVVKGEDATPWIASSFVRPYAPVEIGLNWATGPKWPTKSWPKEKWDDLHDRLSRRYSVSWQRGFNSLDEYIDWIASCRTLVSTDSLGLHLAVALGKKVVALCGPTSASDFSVGPEGIVLSPASFAFECAPCLSPICSRELSCMQSLSVGRVESAVGSLIEPGREFEATA